MPLDPSTSLLLACTFVDQKFAHRVPPNGRLIRAFFGGAAADRIARCNNDEIAAIARLELARALHASTPLAAASPAPPPVLTVVRRWPNSLPQYAVGHPDRVVDIEAHLLATLSPASLCWATRSMASGFPTSFTPPAKPPVPPQAAMRANVRITPRQRRLISASRGLIPCQPAFAVPGVDGSVAVSACSPGRCAPLSRIVGNASG